MKPVREWFIRLQIISILCLSIFWMVACQGQPSESLPTLGSSSAKIDSHTERSVIRLPLDRQQIRFESYTVEDGLSMNTVNDVVQDRRGYIWVATEDGLNRFDGYNFRIYRSDPTKPDGLSSNNIQSLFLDQQGNLWVGGYEGGIMRYDPHHDTFQHFSPKVGNSDIKILVVTAIEQDHLGNLWFGTNDGLYQYDPGADHWSYHQADPQDPNSLNSNTINVLWVDPSDRLWVGTDQGLDLLSKSGQFTHYQPDPDNPLSLSSAVIYAIHPDRDGSLWIGSDNGLNRLDLEQGNFEHWFNDPENPKSISDNVVTTILSDANGALWVGTRNGLNHYDTQSGSFTRYEANASDTTSLRDGWVHALHLDLTGGLWVGTAYGGINYYHPLAGQFQHLVPAPATPDRISENSVWSIYQDANDTLWLGTNGGGLKKCTLRPFTCQEYRHDEDNPKSLANDVIVDIHPDGNGGLWLATWGGGLNQFDPDSGEFSHYRAIEGDPSSISSDTVWLILEDSQGIFWIGTMSGLNTFDPHSGQFTQYLNDPANPHSISNDMIVGLFEDSTSQLWIGTQDGLNRFDRATGRFTRIYHNPEDPNSLSHNTIFAFYEDQPGRLWIGTYGGGLNRYDPASDSFTHYRVADGLVNDSIYGILADEAGNLWISTNNGISRFDPAAEIFKNFSVADGLQAREFNFNAYFKNAGGDMFFGGVNGVTAFHPDHILDNPYPPEVVLQSISQGGIALELGQAYEHLSELTLRWPNNYFDFEFAALNYYQPEQNQHAYRLENFDTGWNEIGSRRFGRYTNLPGGTYTLHLKGSNNDGLWNENGKAITIRVIPPLWQNGWFLGAAAFIIFATFFWGYRYRVRTLQNQAAEFEAQIKIRTYEIDTRRQQIEALYKADEDLYRHLNLDQVLQALVDTAVEILKADKGSLLCWDENREYLVIRASHNFHPATVVTTRIPRGSGVVGQVAETGKPIAVEDTSQDPRVTLSITEAEGIRSFFQVPIKTGKEVFGVFSADYAQSHTFSEDEKRLLISLAQRAAIAIQNAQIYQQAQDLAASQERNRLARELHDAVTQTLFSASLIAEALPALWERDPQKGRERLAKLRQMSRGALAEMRALLLELRPAALLETSLENLLRQLGEAVMGRESITVRIAAEGECKLPPDVHIALYRIAQEALNNIVKHAHASQVEINLSYLCRQDGAFEGVELRISDDGRGFNPQEIAPERLGLGFMRERAESIDANLKIESQSGAGVRVIVKWIMEEQP